MTAVIDKLERKKFVRRIEHPTDKRSVLVQVRPEAIAKVARFFSDFTQSMDDLYERYSDAELSTIVDFLTHAAERQREETAKLVASAHE